ncbi:MAG TPA: AIPR family protein [Chlorobiota bacterium]|nr:AIPR family protein [Chlorobiota bacterium]
MDIAIQEFFQDIRQEILSDAVAENSFQLEVFMKVVSNELMETGFIDGFEHCHYRATRGMRVDGYWFNEEGVLDIFVADFDCRRELETLTRLEADAAFRRVVNFFEACLMEAIEPDVTTPEYGLARQISDRKKKLGRVNFHLASERVLSDRILTFEDDKVSGYDATYNVWDISRIYRQRSSRNHKEPLDIDFIELYRCGVSCLPANLGSDTYQSYLIVMPATILADLYGRFSSRLLEQNVRTFLQRRGQVNKGIRTTILNEPHMFFAYNNGITATAQHVETQTTENGLQILRISDLQIVNGGQTTASLFHTQRSDKASLNRVFIQMKLSVFDYKQSEAIVPRISEYANTQNPVNAADFFSNHPFHVRLEEHSRRIWAPAKKGNQRETKWFFERARGQYLDEQSTLSSSEKRRFQIQNPKSQMFTKTELAKYENVFDEHPRWVNLGSQKNFVQYANRIKKEWERSSTSFNELYFKRIVARAVIFRQTEKLVSQQTWYAGGYRANIVAYAIAAIAEVCKRSGKELPWQRIWSEQMTNPTLDESLMISAQFVNGIIMNPPPNASNISEWCKKDDCWYKIRERLNELRSMLPQQFYDDLVSADEVRNDERQGKKEQIEEDGIKIQSEVCATPATIWRMVYLEGKRRRIFTEKELGCLEVAQQIPKNVPTVKQCEVILAARRKLLEDGFVLPT